jgi:DNA-binding transcriptional LysR family regulator
MVRAGEAELGFTSLVRAPADLICVPAAPQELCAALVPGDVVIGPLSLEDLASRDLVALPQGASTRQSLQHAFDLAGLSPRIAVETEVRDALIPLVLAGAGAAVVPRHLAVMAAAQGATVVALSPPLERAVQLLHRPGARSAAATALLAIVTRSIEP